MPVLVLAGLRASPLTGYLGALGTLKVLCEQADPAVRGCWRHEQFRITSHLDDKALVEFFLQRYKPAPIAGPWNADSGFYETSSDCSIRRIENSDDPRFADYREAIGIISRTLVQTGCTEGPSHKHALLKALKTQLPVAARAYLDSVLTLRGDDDICYHSLLLQGGVDGRVDFARAFLERVVRLLLDAHPASEALLRAVLFDDLSDELETQTLGAHEPNSVRGPELDMKALSNPWSWLLAVEGSLLFPHGRSQSPHAASGYPSAVGKETRQRDLRVPLWKEPMTLGEVELRLGQPADDTVLRYSFLPRNGRSYLAIPVARHKASPDQPAPDTSVELGCAMSLASLGETIAPLDLDRDFQGYNLSRRMLDLLRARARQAEKVSKRSRDGFPRSNAAYASGKPAALGHIEAFLHGRTDDSLLERHLRAEVKKPSPGRPKSSDGFLPYPYALCKLAFHQPRGDRRPIRIAIAEHLARGRTAQAMEAAVEFLQPRHPELPRRWPAGPPLDGATSERWAAALLFPISDKSYAKILGGLLA